jgi:hypothetical protein
MLYQDRIATGGLLPIETAQLINERAHAANQDQFAHRPEGLPRAIGKSRSAHVQASHQPGDLVSPSEPF